MDEHLIGDGTIGRSRPECDPWDWEVWVDGGMVTLNMARPGSGGYEVATGLSVEETDRLARALTTAVHRLLQARQAPAEDPPTRETPRDLMAALEASLAPIRRDRP